MTATPGSATFTFNIDVSAVVDALTRLSHTMQAMSKPPARDVIIGRHYSLDEVEQAFSRIEPIINGQHTYEPRGLVQGNRMLVGTYVRRAPE